MRVPSFCFVASMSISDLLMGVVVIPISLGYHISFQTTGKVTNLTWDDILRSPSRGTLVNKVIATKSLNLDIFPVAV